MPARGARARARHRHFYRDIKPENIILTVHRTANVLDFGITKRLAAGNDDAPATLGSTMLTAQSSVVGTVG